MCSWRRSLKIFGQTSKVMNKALEEKEYRFLFLTLTCKNVDGEDLSNQIDELFKAFTKITRRKTFKQSVKGWFRALEVTHKDWVELWKSCLKIDYDPLVNIKAFKAGTKEETEKSIAEVAKYAIKDDDLIIKNENGQVDEKLTDDAVFILDKALANRRLVAFGGRLKEIQQQLKLDDMENGDLINTDNEDEQLRDDLKFVIEIYHWKVGYNQYIKI